MHLYPNGCDIARTVPSYTRTGAKFIFRGAVVIEQSGVCLQRLPTVGDDKTTHMRYAKYIFRSVRPANHVIPSVTKVQICASTDKGSILNNDGSLVYFKLEGDGWNATVEIQRWFRNNNVTCKIAAFNIGGLGQRSLSSMDLNRPISNHNELGTSTLTWQKAKDIISACVNHVNTINQ